MDASLVSFGVCVPSWISVLLTVCLCASLCAFQVNNTSLVSLFACLPVRFTPFLSVSRTTKLSTYCTALFVSANTKNSCALLWLGCQSIAGLFQEIVDNFTCFENLFDQIWCSRANHKSNLLPFGLCIESIIIHHDMRHFVGIPWEFWEIRDVQSDEFLCSHIQINIKQYSDS